MFIKFGIFSINRSFIFLENCIFVEFKVKGYLLEGVKCFVKIGDVIIVFDVKNKKKGI